MEHRPVSPILDADLLLTDGRRLGYALWGDPAGQPVLLFPGSPSSRLFCPDPAATAEAGVSLVTVDRPGYGRSDVQPGRTILDWPGDVEQLADDLKIHRFAVAAHSSGGPYALACALMMPHRVTGVALVSCVAPLDEVPAAAASLDDAERQLVELAREDPERAAETIAQAAAWLVQEPEVFLTFPRPEPDAVLLDDPATRSMFLDALRESVRAGLAGYVTDEVLERRPWGFRLGDIAVDVALWHGEQDKYISRANAEAMAGLLPNCRTRFHQDQGHGLIIARWSGILNDLHVVDAGPGPGEEAVR
jgi:pimeloyl-ACP methyl ester carboxylesterase